MVDSASWHQSAVFEIERQRGDKVREVPGSEFTFRLPSPPLESGTATTLSLTSTENAVLDRLYADEFKRFIAGKIVGIAIPVADCQSQGAKGRLGVAIDQHGRGDLAEVFCTCAKRYR